MQIYNFVPKLTKIGEIKFYMDSFWLVFGIAVVFVALFVLGMSLTLIFKGHHIESEIGDNPNMKKRGIKCAAQQMREQEPEFGASNSGDAGDCSHNCGSCAETQCVEETSAQKEK